MKTIQFLTLALTSAMLAFTSCQKETDVKLPEQNTPPKQYQLLKYEQSATDYAAFTYNTGGQITDILSVEGGEQQHIAITYSADKRPDKALSDGRSLKFHYSNNQLERTFIMNDKVEDAISGYIIFSYNGSKVSEASLHVAFDAPGPDPISKFTYEYDADGNVKRKTNYMWDASAEKYLQGESVVYEYDKRVNPFNQLPEFYQSAFEMPSTHNVVKETSYDEYGAITSTTTYTYTYNNDGYPIQAEKRVSATGQANASVSAIKYIYK
jgi:hypothetical protein